MARLAMTSLAFMLEEVPDPVWKISTGNSRSSLLSTTSVAAATMAWAVRDSSPPRSRFTSAAARFTRPKAWIIPGGMGRPLMGKFSTARWVCAPHSACEGTFTSPMESFSIRYSLMESSPLRAEGGSG